MNGWEESAESWVRRMDAGEANRTELLDPEMLSLAGDVAGLRVLDVGCGEGRFARMLGARGAHVVALDPTLSLVRLASSRHQDGAYLRASGERMPFADGSFNIVVTYLTLIDIPDFRASIREMARVLRPNGSLLIANLNSFSTSTVSGWVKDEEGKKLYMPVDRYMEERADWLEFQGLRIVNWHRPFSAYMQALLGEGLTLEHFDEPLPGPEFSSQPHWADYARSPYFHVMRWRESAARA